VKPESGRAADIRDSGTIVLYLKGTAVDSIVTACRHAPLPKDCTTLLLLLLLLLLLSEWNLETSDKSDYFRDCIARKSGINDRMVGIGTMRANRQQRILAYVKAWSP
jgi:hypothetical protein